MDKAVHQFILASSRWIPSAAFFSALNIAGNNPAERQMAVRTANSPINTKTNSRLWPLTLVMSKCSWIVATLLELQVPGNPR
jgi:hypothetical protein